MTRKKIIPITIGAITIPNNSPNLDHNTFKGVSIFEFNIPRNKNINAIIRDQNLTEPPFANGHKPIIKKTIKKTKPKLLFVLFSIFLLFSIIY